MTERDMMLKKIGMLKFAITDIDLFLDTHPADRDMVQKRAVYERELMPLIQAYEEKFGPLTKDENSANKWAWVKDPWPWDTEV